MLLIAGFALAWLDFGWFRVEIASYRASIADQVLASASSDSIAAFGSAGIFLAGAGLAFATAGAERRRSTDPLARHPVVLVVADTLLIIGVLLALVEVFVACRMISPGWSIP
ncbi:MAG TPA: hypothetical protein VJ914_33940 [Pseudonocardiaceae bacterium]|nr:hypothetical protein [Pseudonocardiaceae bacterium]